MMIANRRPCTFGALFLSFVFFCAARPASAQTTTAPTEFQKFMDHFDLGVGGAGQFNTTTSGLNYLSQQVQLVPSNTLGALIELRYTVSPKIGIVYNYSYARYVDNYTLTDTAKSPVGTTGSILGIQTKASEYSLGYVGHLHNFFDLNPFVSVGGGVLGFRPTAGGGLNIQGEARGLVYGAIGVEHTVFGDHFGLRLQYREIFFGAPDFNTNYLANGARSYTAEPTGGFFLKF